MLAELMLQDAVVKCVGAEARIRHAMKLSKALARMEDYEKLLRALMLVEEVKTSMRNDIKSVSDFGH